MEKSLFSSSLAEGRAALARRLAIPAGTVTEFCMVPGQQGGESQKEPCLLLCVCIKVPTARNSATGNVPPAPPPTLSLQAEV